MVVTMMLSILNQVSNYCSDSYYNDGFCNISNFFHGEFFLVTVTAMIQDIEIIMLQIFLIIVLLTLLNANIQLHFSYI
jgi:hypothetical protein